MAKKKPTTKQVIEKNALTADTSKLAQELLRFESQQKESRDNGKEETSGPDSQSLVNDAID